MAEIDPALQDKINSLQDRCDELIAATRAYEGGTVAGASTALDEAVASASAMVSAAQLIAAEFGDLEDLAIYVQRAEQAASDADAALNNAYAIYDGIQAVQQAVAAAEDSELQAAQSASNAATSESNASSSAIAAASSATVATDKAGQAAQSASSASGSAQASASSASAAAASEANAASSEGAASSSATAAQNARSGAESAEYNASQSATQASNSAAAAAASETNAADSAAAAAISASEAEFAADDIATNASNISTNASNISSLAAVASTAFTKSDGSQPAWAAPTSSTLETASDLALCVGSTIVEIAAGTPVALPALSNGTDYTVYAHDDGTLEAVDADSAAPANTRVVGGFHSFANGGIASRSLWDLNWLPSAPRPRAMVLSPDGRTWADIYLMDIEYALHGYSRNGQQIADGGSRPVIPAIYGGDGTAIYGSMSWWVAVDIARAAGKRLPSYAEFTAFAYGVVERQAVGSDPVTTQHQAGHRSACGVEQATGVMWQWGGDLSGYGDGWTDIADGRGDVYASWLRAVRLGAYWGHGSHSGSRASSWYYGPDSSDSGVGARAACDHLNLQPTA